MNPVMKSLLIVAVLASSLAHAGQDVLGTSTKLEPAGAWAGSSRKLVLKAHPLQAIGGAMIGAPMLPVEMEYAFAPGYSLSAMATPFVLTGFTQAAGLELRGGVRGYFSGNAPDGFWLGAQMSTTLAMPGIVGVDLHPSMGYQWVLGNGFTVGLNAGVSMNLLLTGRFPLVVQVPLGFAW
jgi:hypothetical protein